MIPLHQQYRPIKPPDQTCNDVHFSHILELWTMGEGLDGEELSFGREEDVIGKNQRQVFGLVCITEMDGRT